MASSLLLVLLCLARPVAAKEGDKNPMVSKGMVCVYSLLMMAMENVPSTWGVVLSRQGTLGVSIGCM